MTGTERLQRIFRRVGLADVARDTLATVSGGVVLVRADWVYDESLIAALAKRPNALLIGPAGEPLAAHVEGAAAAKVAGALEGRGDAAALAGLERLDPAALAY